jgi:hypothetical protein
MLRLALALSGSSVFGSAELLRVNMKPPGNRDF